MSSKTENRIIDLVIILVTLILWALAWPWLTHGYDKYAAVVADILNQQTSIAAAAKAQQDGK